MAFESILEKLQKEWANRGWNHESLHSFFMKKEEEESDDSESETEEEEEDDNLPVVENGMVKISQKAMTQLMQRERSKGKRSAAREFLNKHGVKSESELEQLLKDKKDLEDSTKSETDKAKSEAQKDRDEAARERATVKKERFETKLERLLVRSNINGKRLDKAIRLMDVEDYDMSDEDLKDEVDDFVKEYPEWFKAEDGEDDDDAKKKKPRTPGTKVPGNPRKSGEPTAADKAKDRLAKRHPSVVKQSS